MLYTRPYNMFMNYIAYYELYSQFGDMLYTTVFTPLFTVHSQGCI